MSIRAEKVASTLKRTIAQPINDIAKELSAGLVTVTSVKMTADLQLARIYLSIFGKKSSPGEFISELEQRKGELRKIVGNQIRLRHTPDLQFFLDDTLDQIERIQDLLDSVKKDDQSNSPD